MSPAIERLGIIAGSRRLPFILAESARASGVKHLVAVGFTGETDPALAGVVDELDWVKVGQLGKMINAFRERGVAHCVMAGQVSPKNLFDLRPDWRALSVLLRLKERNARTIFGAIADELRKEGVELLDGPPWFQHIIPGPAYRTGPKLSAAQQAGLDYGLGIAREISRLDIGQTVVVKDGTVLAVEGFEGTDACLQRGGELAGKSGGAMAVKVASANHDFRFDIPCVGPRTRDLWAARLAVLGFESGKTLLLDREELEQGAIRSRDYAGRSGLRATAVELGIRTFSAAQAPYS